MTDKQKYWLTDLAGTRAFVEGADERARWIPRGWTDADEPTDADLVWVRCEGVDEPGRLAYGALREVFHAKGWEPSAPPEPIDPITGVRPPAPVPTADAAADSKPQAKSTADVKEKNRG